MLNGQIMATFVEDPEAEHHHQARGARARGSRRRSGAASPPRGTCAQATGEGSRKEGGGNF